MATKATLSKPKPTYSFSPLTVMIHLPSSRALKFKLFQSSQVRISTSCVVAAGGTSKRTSIPLIRKQGRIALQTDEDEESTRVVSLSSTEGDEASPAPPARKPQARKPVIDVLLSNEGGGEASVVTDSEPGSDSDNQVTNAQCESTWCSPPNYPRSLFSN
jgi:hypothetical protein